MPPRLKTNKNRQKWPQMIFTNCSFKKEVFAGIKWSMTILLFVLFCLTEAFATAQISDILIFEGDTLSLYANPLESYRPRPVFFLTESGRRSYNTGCWRGYQAVWKIDDRILYLVDVLECRGDRTADLVKHFGARFIDGKVRADWYTGDLRIPKGELLEYVHMGYMSVYEKEIVIEIDSGMVRDINEYETRTEPIPDDFAYVMTLHIRAIIPKSLELCADLYDDTICFVDNNCSMELNGFINWADDRLNHLDRISSVESMIDSCVLEYTSEYEFTEPNFEKQRWGFAGWIDGHSKINGELFRIFAMANIGSKLILHFRATEHNKDNFKWYADTISRSIRLMEFGF